ncbi:hypothetical protein, partial [Bacillus mycoides]|uniref:hypothetical protein n=1 Tax=Bacillus mycoides TaxID=1405 RepID=UPI003A7FB3FD
MNFTTKLGELGRIIKIKRSLDNRGEELANTDKELLAEADAAVGLIDSLQRTVECFGMEMKAVIPLSSLRRLANEGETLHGLDYRFGVTEETMVNLYGLAYINAAKVQVSYMGKTYTIATRIHNGTFTVNVWDESGSTSIGDNKWDEK